MAIYKEKNTANTGVLARIFDAEDGHFGPTRRAAPDFFLFRRNRPIWLVANEGEFNEDREKSGAVKILDCIEFRP